MKFAGAVAHFADIQGMSETSEAVLERPVALGAEHWKSVRRTQREAERAATEVLSAYWKSRKLPVDTVQLAQDLGAKVFTAQLDPDVSGFILKDEGEDARIYIEKGDSPTRQRFTCAHEIGHLAKHNSDNELAFVDYRDEVATTGKNLDEVFANTFAAALLMPEPEFSIARKTGASRYELAKQFNVSPHSVAVHLDYLKKHPPK